jgi:hypothetical protein
MNREMLLDWTLEKNYLLNYAKWAEMSKDTSPKAKQRAVSAVVEGVTQNFHIFSLSVVPWSDDAWKVSNLILY